MKNKGAIMPGEIIFNETKETFKGTVFITLITILGSVASFWPIYAGTSVSVVKSSNIIVNDDVPANYLFLTAIIVIPMAMDAIMDGKKVWRSQNKDLTMHWLVQWILVCVYVVPHVVIDIWSIGTDNSTMTIVFRCTNALINIIAYGSILCYLSLPRDAQQLPSHGRLSVVTTICYALGTCLQLDMYTINHTIGLGFAGLAGNLLLGISYVMMLYQSYPWIMRWKNQIVGKQQINQIKVEDLRVGFYLSALLLLSVGTTVQNIIEATMMTSSNIGIYWQMAAIVVVTALPGRVVRLQLTQAITLLDERQAFMRYVSHEIRGPLSTVILGINYVQGELEETFPHPDETMMSVLECVEDVHKSCEDALSVINDLLMYDKLQEGKVALEFGVVPIEAFMTDMVKPYRAQARSKNISMYIRYEEEGGAMSAVSNISGYSGQGSWQFKTALMADKHKLGQVVRNLLSNALKFTGNDGSIHVTVTRYRELANISINKNNTKSNEEGGSGSFKENTLGFLKQATAIVRKSLGSSFELFKYHSFTKLNQINPTAASKQPNDNQNNNNHRNIEIIPQALASETHGPRILTSQMSPLSPGSPVPSPPPMSPPNNNSRASLPAETPDNGNAGRGNRGSRSHHSKSGSGSDSRGNRGNSHGGSTKRGQNKAPSVFDFKYLLIEVKDTGAGMSSENMKKLFGQYVQFNAGELQNGGGSGLGLWISKGIVDMHGGMIGATSAGAGQGSTFYVILPIYQQRAESNVSAELGGGGLSAEGLSNMVSTNMMLHMRQTSHSRRGKDQQGPSLTVEQRKSSLMLRIASHSKGMDATAQAAHEQPALQVNRSPSSRNISIRSKQQQQQQSRSLSQGLMSQSLVQQSQAHVQLRSSLHGSNDQIIQKGHTEGHTNLVLSYSHSSGLFMESDQKKLNRLSEKDKEEGDDGDDDQDQDQLRAADCAFEMV